MKDLTLKKEKAYFNVMLVLAILIWPLMFASVVLIAYSLIWAIYVWVTNGLFIARLKSECVLVNESQFPKLYETYKQVCDRLEVSKMPELYILESGRKLNAFVFSHSGRDFVVLESDIVVNHGEEGDEIRFILGHELGHIKSGYGLKRIFLGPALWLPLLGAAYSRACEASCDRYGAYATQNIDGAIKALMILSRGKEVGNRMSGEHYSQQHKNHRGFFVSWYELISGHPTVSQRVANLISMRSGEKRPPKYPRHWLAYIFAFFASGGILITIAMLAILAVSAIPNLLRAKQMAKDHHARKIKMANDRHAQSILSQAANDRAAQKKLSQMAKAAREFAHGHDERYPISVDEFESDDRKYPGADYCGKVIEGFSYTCMLTSRSFQFTATPEKGTTGKKVFMVSARYIAEAVSVPDNLLIARLKGNEKQAQTRLSEMVGAAGTFARDHDARYPISTEEFENGNKKYLGAHYCGKVMDGFSYNCMLTPHSFQVTATPENETTGRIVFMVSARDLAEVAAVGDGRNEVERNH